MKVREGSLCRSDPWPELVWTGTHEIELQLELQLINGCVAIT